MKINYKEKLMSLGRFIKNLPKNIYTAIKETTFFILDIVYLFVVFTLIVFFYLGNKLFSSKLVTLPFIPVKLATTAQVEYFKFYSKVIKIIDSRSQGSISKLDLMDLAIKNMIVKKTRALITIGGVAIGFGAIVFLVSIGYGLQELVISRVARLDELRQADVSVRAGSKMKINDKILTDIKGIPNVAETLPLISAVGKVSYQNSSADVAVFGVTTDYLESSAIRTTQGKMFESREISYLQEENNVLEETKEEDKLGYVVISMPIEEWIPVRQLPRNNAPIIGYTKRGVEDLIGQETLGDLYTGITEASKAVDGEGNELGKWVKTKYQLWEKTGCDITNVYCVDGNYLVMREESGAQKSIEGYITQVNLDVKKYEGNTDGLSSAGSISIISTDDPNFVEIPEETAASQVAPVKKVLLSTKALKQAVVNRAMLNLLGINENEAVGKKFEVSYIITSDLLADSKEKVESVLTEYEIIGVTPDDNAPSYYVPFIDLRSLGVANYSQLKVVVRDKESLENVRKQIEAIGFETRSVTDTVSQITNLFKTARTILGIMGTVALVVAALGMFNTFTVSLLERTREVGLMKAIGMKSNEVQELFLIEALIMGFGGGIGGVILGYLMGKGLSSFLSVFSVSKGLGTIDISYIPSAFVLLILFLSLFIGAITGLYPARRARKITALNALRYE